MPLDPDDLAEMQEIMEAEMPDTAHVYRIKRATGTPSSTSMSDGFGGIILDTNKADNEDQREYIKTYSCRGTVPRANRDQSEYSDWQNMVSETRIMINLPFDADIQLTDGIMWINAITGKVLNLEVKVIQPRADGITLQLNCVEIAEQPDFEAPTVIIR